MVRNTPKNAEPTAKAKLPPFVRGLLCIGTVLLVCFVVSIMLEVWYLPGVGCLCLFAARRGGHYHRDACHPQR